MSNHIRDEGPLPEEALRHLSYLNETINRAEELEAENERLRKTLDEAFQSLGRLVHDPAAVEALLEVRAAWLASGFEPPNSDEVAGA